MDVLDRRMINLFSGVLAASFAVGAVSAYDCGSVDDIALQSPLLANSNKSTSDDSEVEVNTLETGNVPYSYGNASINIDDYTIVLLSSYAGQLDVERTPLPPIYSLISSQT